jgi:hypothetical protein
MMTDYETPRINRAARFWRAAFIGTLAFLMFYAAFCLALMSGWWAPPEWLMKHFG